MQRQIIAHLMPECINNHIFFKIYGIVPVYFVFLHLEI